MTEGFSVVGYGVEQGIKGVIVNTNGSGPAEQDGNLRITRDEDGISVEQYVRGQWCRRTVYLEESK